ncbi:MAG: glycosyltransferase [Cyanobacteria bacterium P01_F01_bin.143]
MKIGLLFSSYGPYHIARLESLKKINSIQVNQFMGIELARSQELYPWQTRIDNLSFPIVSIIKGQSLEQIKLVFLLKKLLKVLNKVNPEILAISGYFKISMLVSLIWCKLHNKPAILFSETTENDFERIWWKEKIKSLIVKQFKSALVGGKPHKRYLIKLGMPEEAIFCGYDVVGNDTFNPNKIKCLPNPLSKPFFLAINRFVTKKNLPFILDAYAKYRQSSVKAAWDLVLCGDGELRWPIEQKITKLNLQDSVHLPGFLQQKEMLPYFAHANCFIHASTTEQWGLVVNEAMAAGLPLLVSNHCGCFEDLVLEGVNGFGFDPTNVEELTQLMLSISSEKIGLQKMGQASLEHIKHYAPNYFATGFAQAVEYAMKK